MKVFVLSYTWGGSGDDGHRCAVFSDLDKAVREFNKLVVEHKHNEDYWSSSFFNDKGEFAPPPDYTEAYCGEDSCDFYFHDGWNDWVEITVKDKIIDNAEDLYG